MSETRRKFRIFSLEGGILAFSLFALSSGFMRGDLLSIFWGGICALGLVALHFIRRKDWAQHWAAMDEKFGRRE
ncbi:MAG: hypothetical protein Q7U44_05000 [Desulfuromonadales bacterium]|nr:hypothetical protein [Desulfuromonadales bacterium]